jgi:flagellar assembly protein FliH
MSSKVYQAGDELPVNPLVWRQVGTAPAGEAVPGAADQRAQLEAQYRQKAAEAHAAGLREGEAAGRNRAAAELQPVLERLARSTEEIAGMRARLRREAESDVVQLALAIARRVILRELSADPDALRGLVMAAFETLQGQEIARVRVHPSHVALLTSCLEQASGGAPVAVVPDQSREVGSVVFETTRGNLDASVDSQLQEIERGLTDRLRKQS